MEKKICCKVKSVKIIVNTDNGIDKFITKKPVAIIVCSLGRKGEKPGRGSIQLIGKKNYILYAYFILTKELIKSFGGGIIIKILSLVFEKDLKKIEGKLKLIKMARSGKNNQTIN